jgi:methylmalonyl-CoA/ethylmalonyl-CoA epimerase
MIKRLHHIGIAVNNLQESVALYERILGLKPLSIVEAPCQQVKEAVFKVGEGPEIDLLEPTAPDSAVARFLGSRGQGIHHLCFEVDNVDEELKAMAEKGVELIDRQGREGVAGKIGFLHPKSAHGVLIELVEPGE